MTDASIRRCIDRGDILGAIDLLEHVDDEQRPSDGEIVELRHHAFAQLDKRPGRADWPPRYEDPFATETGVPTLDRGALSGGRLDADLVGGAITNHGCVRIDRMIDEHVVHEFRSIIDAAFDDRERLRAGEHRSSDSPVLVPFAHGSDRADGFGGDVFVRVCDVPVAMRRLLEVFASTGLRSAVERYFAERPAMIANKWILRRSPSGVITSDFHQDGAFLGDGIRTVDCWIALSDCGPGTGRPAIDLFPHRYELIEPDDKAVFSWSLSVDAAESANPDVPVVSPVFRAGDALIFDERLPHRTTPGTDLGRRYAIESWFVAPSSYSDRHVPIVI